MRGKYRRKRERKKYLKYIERFKYFQSNPNIFMEEMFGVKLFK